MAATPLSKRLLFAAVPSVALLLGLAGVELYLRATGFQPESSDASQTVMVPDPTRIWRLPTGTSTSFGGTHTITTHGLRAVQAEGDPNVIVTTGDSSIFGHGLSDEGTLHAQLEEALESRGTAVDVYCGGIPGYSTAQTLVLLDEELWDLEPDLLVVGNMWSDSFEGGFSDAELLQVLRSPANQARAWASRFKLFQAASQALSEGRQEQSFVNVGWMQQVPEAREPRVPLDHYYDNLHQILDQAVERDVSVVMLEPCAQFSYNVYENPPSINPYAQVLRRVASERSAVRVYACDALYQARMSTAQSFIDDLHPSASGNRAYAALLAQTLSEKGWPSTKLVPAPR